jgi:hypothetical protein
MQNWICLILQGSASSGFSWSGWAGLSEEAVNQIFENGMVISANPVEKKFKLNIEPLFPKKIVDFAIHQFFNLNSITQGIWAIMYYFSQVI